MGYVFSAPNAVVHARQRILLRAVPPSPRPSPPSEGGEGDAQAALGNLVQPVRAGDARSSQRSRRALMRPLDSRLPARLPLPRSSRERAGVRVSPQVGVRSTPNP